MGSQVDGSLEKQVARCETCPRFLMSCYSKFLTFSTTEAYSALSESAESYRIQFARPFHLDMDHLFPKSDLRGAVPP